MQKRQQKRRLRAGIEKQRSACALTVSPGFLYDEFCWALSSAVRAFGLHPKGRPFESDSAHHFSPPPDFPLLSCFLVSYRRPAQIANCRETRKSKLENRSSKFASGCATRPGLSPGPTYPVSRNFQTSEPALLVRLRGAGGWQAAADKPKFRPPRESLRNGCARMTRKGILEYEMAQRVRCFLLCGFKYL